MRIVSMVPSITETLIEAGLEVVGRTRFCVHPAVAVEGIPAIGGTKGIDWEKFRALGADLLILDKEENLPWMRDQAPCEVMIAHVTSISTARELADDLSQRFAENAFLRDHARRWLAVENAPSKIWDWNRIPAALETWGSPEDAREMVYLIWKNPWMAVSQGTFIASVIEKLGGGDFLLKSEQKYPTMEEEDLPGKFCLFSTEPFPFEKHRAELAEWAPEGALVDGESFSWFGIRSLRFLESELVSFSSPE